MCGIAGFSSHYPDARAPTGLAEGIRHRGPDGEGAHRAQLDTATWTLFHSRLAIVDLSDAASQPMPDEVGEWVMTYNGELYNHAELRSYCEARGHRFRSSMDGEVILHLWEELGEQALHKLNGIFAFAIANTRTSELVLVRDPLGVKPLFYSLDGDGQLWFASEIGALTGAGAPAGSQDLVGLAQFLSFLWIPAPRTPFTGIRALEPGQLLRWGPHGTTTSSYADWLIAPAEADHLQLPEATSAAGELLHGAAQRQLLGDVPIGLMASGGVDSSLIWWAANQGIDKAFTISWQRDSYGERLDEDARAVKELQRHFRTDVDFIPGEDAEGEEVPPSGDLFADPAYDLARLISRRARDQGFKVLLSGQGADEVLAGYRRHVITPILARLYLGTLGTAVSRCLSRLPAQRLGFEYLARTARASSNRDAFSRYMELCTYSTSRYRAQVLGCYENEVTNEVVSEQHRFVYERQPTNASFLKKVLAVDLNVYLPGLGLAYVDRAGMEFGVEIRVPWLDLELVRWALTLPDACLLQGRQSKPVSKRLAEQAFGERLAHRAKRGFAAPTSGVTGSNGVPSDTGFRQDYYAARASKLLGSLRA